MESTFPITSPSSKPNKKFLILGAVLVLLGGGIAGYFIAPHKSGSRPAGAAVEGAEIKTDTEQGVTDTTTFGDSATGKLEKEGVNGVGTHKLLREGGVTQTACLTSSVVDLDEFADKQVQVWGQTIKTPKCGWFMDVGRIKLLE